MILFLLFFQGSTAPVSELIIEVHPVTEITRVVKVREAMRKEISVESFINENTIKLMYATIYRVDPKQCWGNPLITADGTPIDTVLLNRDSIKFIAVSQDMLKRNGGIFRYGDSVYINIPNAPNFTGKYIVHDCMNKRYKRSVDILTGVRKKGNLWKNATITKL